MITKSIFWWMMTATTFIPRSQDQLVLESEKVCAYDVLSVESSSIKGTIVTTAKVKAFKCFKGEAGTELVRWPGGTVNGRKAYVASTPDLKVGQKAILYLWRASPQDIFTVNSWTHGVEALEWDAKQNDFVLSRTGGEIMVKKSKDKDAKPQKAFKRKTTLSEFEKKVTSIISR